MSVPTYSIQCDKCDYKSGSGVLFGSYKYQDSEGLFQCARQLGWCDDCAMVQPIEDFYKGNDALTKIIDSNHDIEKSTRSIWSNILNALIPSRRQSNTRSAKSAESAAKYIKVTYDRAGCERCLECGSYSVKPYRPNKISGDLGIETDLVFTGRNITDFIHPNCGGTFNEVGPGMRFSFRLKTYVYTPQGDFIESYSSN